MFDLALVIARSALAMICTLPNELPSLSCKAETGFGIATVESDPDAHLLTNRRCVTSRFTEMRCGMETSLCRDIDRRSAFSQGFRLSCRVERVLRTARGRPGETIRLANAWPGIDKKPIF